MLVGNLRLGLTHAGGKLKLGLTHAGEKPYTGTNSCWLGDVLILVGNLLILVGKFTLELTHAGLQPAAEVYLTLVVSNLTLKLTSFCR